MDILKLVKTALRACALASLLWLPSGLAQMGGPALVKVAVASLKDIAPVTMVPGTVVSRSGDGELLARVLRAQGFSLVRGSSSRDGSAAARGVLRALRGLMTSTLADVAADPDPTPAGVGRVVGVDASGAATATTRIFTHHPPFFARFTPATELAQP